CAWRAPRGSAGRSPAWSPTCGRGSTGRTPSSPRSSRRGSTPARTRPRDACRRSPCPRSSPCPASSRAASPPASPPAASRATPARTRSAWAGRPPAPPCSPERSPDGRARPPRAPTAPPPPPPPPPPRPRPLLGTPPPGGLPRRPPPPPAAAFAVLPPPLLRLRPRRWLRHGEVQLLVHALAELGVVDRQLEHHLVSAEVLLHVEREVDALGLARVDLLQLEPPLVDDDAVARRIPHHGGREQTRALARILGGHVQAGGLAQLQHPVAVAGLVDELVGVGELRPLQPLDRHLGRRGVDLVAAQEVPRDLVEARVRVLGNF